MTPNDNLRPFLWFTVVGSAILGGLGTIFSYVIYGKFSNIEWIFGAILVAFSLFGLPTINLLYKKSRSIYLSGINGMTMMMGVIYFFGSPALIPFLIFQ